MQKNLHRFKQLTVISDTAMYVKDGKFYGFGPVVRELEYISHLFEKIIWVGFEREDLIGNPIMDLINLPHINLVFLKKTGGNSLLSKLGVILNTPLMLFTIIKSIYKADVVHTRAPSSPAFLAILLSFISKNKIWWNKYAGNWVQENPPFFFGLQKYVLQKAKHSKVTVNGKWLNQLPHIYSFENPCLTEDQLTNGIEIIKRKKIISPFKFIFIGRLDDEKGIKRIMEALKIYSNELVESVDFIGDGEKLLEYQEDLRFLGDKIHFHSSLSNKDIHRLLAESHFLLLPSTASEGFPKVIAEASCYGCIPIVSNISSIGQYINSSNGFLWDIKGSLNFTDYFNSINFLDALDLSIKSSKIITLGKLFSFRSYYEKLCNNILNIDPPLNNKQNSV
jgi:glycosyltransferase involved in cell wall biosynthesis